MTDKRHQNGSRRAEAQSATEIAEFHGQIPRHRSGAARKPGRTLGVFPNLAVLTLACWSSTFRTELAVQIHTRRTDHFDGIETAVDRLHADQRVAA